MRDVTPPHSAVDFKELLKFIFEFIKQPIDKISRLPEWNWASLFTVHLLLSLASGVLAGLLKLNFYRIAAGLFLMPVVSTISAFLLSLFLYYYFQFFEKRTESFKKLFTLVVLASIPFYLFQIISEYFSPVSLVGFAFTSLLGVVGLCDNFRLEKNRAYRLVGFIFAAVVATWVLNQF
jgi:hypothetical protein